MTRYFKVGMMAALLAVMFAYSGCGPGKDPDPSIEEQKFELMNATWTISNVTLDGVSKITDYTGFKLTLGGSLENLTYSVTGRPALSPWLASGTWEFAKSPADPATKVVRDPGTVNAQDVNYTVTDSQLQLTFIFSKDGFSRTSNVKGEWVFTFTK